jgi:hypothetical protein
MALQPQSRTPFGKSEAERRIRLEDQIRQVRVEQQQRTASSLLTFGLALPYVVMMVGVLALACFIGWALKVLP